MKKSQSSSNHELTLLKEEMKMLQKTKILRKERDLTLTIEEYHKYLETTRGVAKEALNPTELVVSTRRR